RNRVGDPIKPLREYKGDWSALSRITAERLKRPIRKSASMGSPEMAPYASACGHASRRVTARAIEAVVRDERRRDAPQHEGREGDRAGGSNWPEMRDVLLMGDLSRLRPVEEAIIEILSDPSIHILDEVR